MVRVISVHHFASQDIHTCEEPSAVTTAPTDRLLIALPQHAIEVRDLRKGGVPSFTFPTVGEVTHMVHCCHGNYVATLEAKKNRQGKEASFARIYANWDIPSKAQPMRVRIAGRVTPSSQSGANSLEMIELPVKRTPNVLACCQVSGNLLVGSHKTLFLYKFHVRTHDISKLKFLDFEECLGMELSFCPSHIALCEDVVTAMSKESLHVFHIAAEMEQGEERGVRDGSEQEKRRGQFKRRTFLEKDGSRKPKSPVVLANVVKQASSLGSGNASLRSRLHADSFPIVVHLPFIVEHNKNLSANQLLNVTQRAGPFRDARLDMSVKVVTVPELQIEVKVRHLLCLQIHACSRANREEFRCLQIRPMYVEQAFKVDSISSHPMHSAFVKQLMSIAIAVTTQQEGYVYHVNYKAASATSQSAGSSMEIVSPPTVYPFTAPVTSIALERSILHALTETGLETYTGRSGHHLMQLFHNEDSSQTASPPVEDPVCLVGLRPFLGVEHLLVWDSYLCLLACSEGSSTSSQDSQGGAGWTLYSLQLPSAADLYQDMIQVAGVHRSTAPATYLHLLAEAHVVLGTARRCLNWRMDSSLTSGSVALASPVLEPTPEANRRLERSYQESCALLADHFIMSDTESSWELVRPYYAMSGLSPQQVVDRFLRMEETIESSDENIPPADEEVSRSRNFQGLMFYLRGELPGANRAVTQERGEVVDFPVEFASQLLELFEQHDPGSVSLLVLSSPNLRQHRMDRVLQVMKRRLLVRSSTQTTPNPDPRDALALVLLCIQKGSLEQARTVLGSLMGSTQLVAALQAHHGLLFNCTEARRKDMTLGFTDLSLLAAEVQPEALASVLTGLALDPASALQLPCSPTLTHLTRAFLTPPCSLSGSSAPPSNASLVLRLFLESFFAQLPSHYSSAEVSEGVCILARSYLGSLKDPGKMPMGSEEVNDEMFGPRLSFLDKMPPFCADSAWKLTQGSTHTAEVCEKPSHNLIKLQSLLCSTRLGRECSAEVLQFLQSYPQVQGYLALSVLCLSPKEATCQLLENCPLALLLYAKDRYISDSDWKYLVSLLQKRINSVEKDSVQSMYYNKIMSDTLGHLAQTLTLEEFVRTLPGGEAAAQSATYKPFVQTCQNVQSANHIRTLIMTTGQQLLATLNL